MRNAVDSCPNGMQWDNNWGRCMPVSNAGEVPPPEYSLNFMPDAVDFCPSWMQWDSDLGQCVSAGGEPPSPDYEYVNRQTCPEGVEQNVYGGCGPFGPQAVTTQPGAQVPWYQSPVTWVIVGLVLLGSMQGQNRRG